MLAVSLYLLFTWARVRFKGTLDQCNRIVSLVCNAIVPTSNYLATPNFFYMFGFSQQKSIGTMNSSVAGTAQYSLISSVGPDYEW